MSETIIIQQTKNWLERVVIGLNFCPFAAREMKRDAIRYVVCEIKNWDLIIQMLREECTHLDENEQTATTLVIFSENFDDFDTFLALLEKAEAELLIEDDYEGIYQLASFHPNYQFADTKKTDAANFTNRSPYPMLHFLREAQIDHALENFDDPESIPEKNMAVARERGYAQMKALRAACF
jgi:uncharacterized protein